jgi:hypothetical protein
MVETPFQGWLMRWSVVIYIGRFIIVALMAVKRTARSSSRYRFLAFL